nr:MAG TPA: hypothetical protein [Caudoviricetes sp.]
MHFLFWGGVTENSGAPLQENSIPFYIISLKFKLKQ